MSESDSGPSSSAASARVGRLFRAAKASLAAGRLGDARRDATHAAALLPGQEQLEQLLGAIKRAEAEAAATARPTGAAAAEDGAARRRPAAAAAAAAPPPPGGAGGPAAAAAAALVAQVLRVRAPRDPYAVLSLPRSASEADVKRAYRRLALQLHPDKCGAPGAEAAFKAVTAAHETLSDRDARLAYDTHGDAGAHRSFAAAAAARQQHAAPGFGGGPGDFTFDDLERWFRAQAAMRHAHAQQRSRGAGAAPPGSGDAELSALRAVLAALVAAVLLFSAATAPAEPAALRRGAATPAGPAATAARGVPFYHAPDFDAAFPVASRRRAEAEHRLENSYGNLLVRECEAQRAAQGSAELWAALRGRPPPPEPPACGELRAKFADWFASAGGVRY